MPPYTTPVNPVNAIAISPAEISTIGVPLKGFGILLFSDFSLIPARITIEIKNPKDVPKEHAILSPKL